MSYIELYALQRDGSRGGGDGGGREGGRKETRTRLTTLVYIFE
jgi:hypothetical protein